MRFSKQSKRNTMIPDLQEDFKSVKKTWTNVSVVVGSTHTYQHMFEDGCPIHARLHYRLQIFRESLAQ
jgi:hypothetical protein